MRKILVLVGTYSEAILMAPLLHRLRETRAVRAFVHVAPAQRAAITHVLGFFAIHPDEGWVEQGTAERGWQDIDRLMERIRPDCVLLHGDASAAIRSSRLSAGPMEAGLRVHELRWPGPPGEFDVASTHFFVTLEASRDNLLRDGVAADRVHLSGSQAAEAMLLAAERVRKDASLEAELAASFPFLRPDKRLILVIGHRREDRGGGLESVCRALKRLAMRSDVQVAYPAPLNPGARSIVEEIFADHPGIALVGPQDYLHMVYLLQAAYLVLADSGATPEEMLALRKPVLVMRSVAERPGAIDAGTVKLVGTDAARIQRECTMFLDDPSYHRAFSTHRAPRADRLDSRRIVDMLLG